MAAYLVGQIAAYFVDQMPAYLVDQIPAFGGPNSFLFGGIYLLGQISFLQKKSFFSTKKSKKKIIP